MATKRLDTKGMRCPQPILALITCMHETAPGDVVEVHADCPSFEEDVRNWCRRVDKTLLAVTHEGDVAIAQIQL